MISPAQRQQEEYRSDGRFEGICATCELKKRFCADFRVPRPFPLIIPRKNKSNQFQMRRNRLARSQCVILRFVRPSGGVCLRPSVRPCVRRACVCCMCAGVASWKCIASRPFLPPFYVLRSAGGGGSEEEEEGGGRVENSALVRSFVLSLTLHLINGGRSHPRDRLRDTAPRARAHSVPRPFHERVERERERERWGSELETS